MNDSQNYAIAIAMLAEVREELLKGLPLEESSRWREATIEVTKVPELAREVTRRLHGQFAAEREEEGKRAMPEASSAGTERSEEGTAESRRGGESRRDNESGPDSLRDERDSEVPAMALGRTGHKRRWFQNTDSDSEAEQEAVDSLPPSGGSGSAF